MRRRNWSGPRIENENDAVGTRLPLSVNFHRGEVVCFVVILVFLRIIQSGILSTIAEDDDFKDRPAEGCTV